MTTLAGVGRRVKNDKRAHLLVSAVLGKHVPVSADEISSVASSLASMVSEVVEEGAIQVITYAEAGIGIGSAVAWSLNAPLIASTRTSSNDVWCAFTEPHSHAAHHAILVKPDGIDEASVVVLVDDEMTTGVTTMNTISALRATDDVSTRRFVIATLVDARTDDDRAALETYARENNLHIDVVALEEFTGSTTPTSDLNEAAGELVGGFAPTLVDDSITVPPLSRGWSSLDMSEIDAELGALAWRLHIDTERRTLVLGTEEFMWPAQRLAKAIGGDVSSTTASPVVVDPDAQDYPIRHGFSFGTPAGVRYAYNTDGYDQIIMVTDDIHSTPVALPTRRSWCVVTERN